MLNKIKLIKFSKNNGKKSTLKSNLSTGDKLNLASIMEKKINSHETFLSTLFIILLAK